MSELTLKGILEFVDKFQNLAYLDTKLHHSECLVSVYARWTVSESLGRQRQKSTGTRNRMADIVAKPRNPAAKPLFALAYSPVAVKRSSGQASWWTLAHRPKKSAVCRELATTDPGTDRGIFLRLRGASWWLLSPLSP
jgi:hypothetical protein